MEYCSASVGVTVSCLIVLLYGIFCGVHMEYQRQSESRSLQVKLPLWPCGNEKQSTRTISTFRLWYFLVCPEAPREDQSQKQDKTPCVCR